MSAPSYRDLTRDIPSLFSSYYTASHRWRISVSARSRKDQLVFHPSASNDGLSIDTELRSSLFTSLVMKAAMTEKTVKKVSASWAGLGFDRQSLGKSGDEGRRYCGLGADHKFSLSTDPRSGGLLALVENATLTHSFKNKWFGINEAICKKHVELQVGVRIADTLGLGASVRVPPMAAAKSNTSTSGIMCEIRARATTCNKKFVTEAFVCDNFKAYAVGAVASVDVSPMLGWIQRARSTGDGKSKTRLVTLGSELKFDIKGAEEGGPSRITAPKVAFAIDTGCPFFKKNSIRARVDAQQRISLCYVMRHKGSTTAFTLSDKGHVGATFAFEESSSSSTEEDKSKQKK